MIYLAIIHLEIPFAKPAECTRLMILIFASARGLIEMLDRRRGQDGAYIGCMKSGTVITEEYTLHNILA